MMIGFKIAKKAAAKKNYGKGSGGASKKPASPSRSAKGTSLGGIPKAKGAIKKFIKDNRDKIGTDTPMGRKLAKANRVYENLGGDYKPSPGTRKATRRKK